MSDNIELPFDAFVRSIKQNRDVEHSFLLGAGASIESKIQSATDCIWEWKKDIFLSKNSHLIKQYSNSQSESVRNSIQRWLDNEGGYPKLYSDEEYSYYAETAYPVDGDRQRYFQRLSEGKEPSLGYHLICSLAKNNIIRSVWTTNFDGLTINAAHKNNLTPIEVTLDSQERLYRSASTKELLCIALHGDYKYGALKNTAKELDNQSEILISALTNQLQSRNLIVIGYSGRDKSLMNALKEAYSQKGGGRLYWCGYGNHIDKNVRELIEIARNNGREAFFIDTDGFDKTLLNIALSCYEDSNSELELVNELKNKFVKDEYVCTPFLIPDKTIKKVIKSNLSPFSFPQACFQFELKYEEGENPWKLCNEYSKEKGISIVPYKGMVYGFGTKDNLFQTFKHRLNSEITQTPLSRNSILNNLTFRELILKTFIKSISEKTDLESNFKNKIWDKNLTKTISVNGISYTIYEAIRLSLFFDKNFNYISIKPSFVVKEEIEDKEAIKEISRQYYLSLYKRRSNSNFEGYVHKWKSKIYRDSSLLKFEYPLKSGSGFTFVLKRGNMYVGIGNDSYYKQKIPSNFNDKQIIHNGIEYNDPQLTFYNHRNNQPIRDFHPMRGLTNNQPYDYFLNDSVYNSKVDLGVICGKEYSTDFSKFLGLLNQKITAQHNADYLMSYPNFISAYGIPINIPAVGNENWLDIELPKETDQKEGCHKLARTITKKIKQLEHQSVVLIFIPSSWDYFTSYKDESGSFDLHDYIKAFAVQEGISTQFIREKTINSDLTCQIIWWLSLAFYVKSLRTPWVLTNLDKETAFAGIGYSVKHKGGDNNIVVGCSHIYTSEGQGLKYKLSKIKDFTLDKKKNPFLSENEAFQLGLNIRELFLKSTGDLPKRVVIHKRTRFTKDEIKGLIQSLNHSGIEEIDLIEINFEDNARFMAMNQFEFKADGYPVRRGTCFPISDNIAYLFTHGIAPSVLDEKKRKYFMGGTSIPIPLKIKKHYGKSNISTIASEILGLSKMNWNSFDLYAKLPCTLQSSKEISRIGWLLSHHSGRTYDYRHFM